MELAARKGFADLTTGEIAERAGVSKGSLYQYFPAREAIFVALYEDASAHMVAVMKGLFHRVGHLPPDEAMRRVIRRHLALVRENELIILQMMREAPELRAKSPLISFESIISSVTRTSLRHNLPRLSVNDVERRVFLIHAIVGNSIREYVEAPPQGATDAAFVRDLADIVTRYSTQP